MYNIVVQRTQVCRHGLNNRQRILRKVKNKNPNDVASTLTSQRVDLRKLKT